MCYLEECACKQQPKIICFIKQLKNKTCKNEPLGSLEYKILVVATKFQAKYNGLHQSLFISM